MLADISGYTSYMAGSEHEHSIEILRELIETIGTEARVIARRVSGEVVGELAIVADQPRVATLLCEGESIVRDRPQVAQAIIRVLGARLAEALRAA